MLRNGSAVEAAVLVHGTQALAQQTRIVVWDDAGRGLHPDIERSMLHLRGEVKVSDPAARE
jgi:hypothetical protein